MNARFWDLFTGDYSANCARWARSGGSTLPPSGDGWKSRWTANPDFFEFGGRTLVAYRGSGEEAGREGFHDRIGIAEVLAIGPDVLELRELNGGRFAIDVGPEGSFDGVDVLDPATVVFNGKVFLYYSAIGDGPDSIGLAVSEDGERFEKVGQIMVGRAPDVLAVGSRLVMLYQIADANGNYRPYLAESYDGMSFTPLGEIDFPRAGWDSLSFVTGRLSQDGDTFYVVYGGSSYLADEPDYFGIAGSRDLMVWEPHPGNPIFGCGAKGTCDGGAIWFPALIETDTHFVMLYEGSRGKYAWDISSVICQAWTAKG